MPDSPSRYHGFIPSKEQIIASMGRGNKKSGMSSGFKKADVELSKFGKTLGDIGKVSGKIGKTVFQPMEKAMKATVFSKGFWGVFLRVLDQTGIMSPIMSALNGLFGIFSGTLMQAVMPAIQGLMDVLLSPEVITAVQDLATSVGELLTPIFEALTPVIAELLPPFLELITMFVDMLKPILEEIIPIMADQFVAQLIAMFDIFEQLMPVIEPLIKLFMSLLEIGMIPLTISLQLLSAILEPMAPYIEKLGEGISWLTKGIENVINFLIKGINKVMNTVTVGLWRDIPLIGEEGAKAREAAQQSAMRAGLDAGEYHAPGGGDWDFSNIDLSGLQFQHGGIITRPTVGMIGESGRPEGIFPLDELYGIMRENRWATEDLGRKLDRLIQLNELGSKKKWR